MRERGRARGMRCRKGPGLGSRVCLFVCLFVRARVGGFSCQRVSGEVGISGRGPAGWFQNAEMQLFDNRSRVQFFDFDGFSGPRGGQIPENMQNIGKEFEEAIRPLEKHCPASRLEHFAS